MRLFFLVTLFVFTLSASNAQTVQYTATLSDWILEDNQTHCLVKSQYDNGIVFILAKNNIGENRLALHFPHKNLPSGQSYDVKLFIDEQESFSQTAIIATESILTIPLEQSSILKKLAKGNTFTMQGPQDMVQFSLKGSGKAIEKLEKCSANQSIAPTAEKQTPLPSWLNALLAQINIKDFQPIVIGNKQAMPLDYAWVTKEIFGGVKLLPLAPYPDAETGIAHYLDILKKLCRGDVLIDAGQTFAHEETIFTPYDLVCSTGKEDTITGLFFAVDESIITVFFFESDSKSNGVSLKKRDQLLKLLTSSQ